MKKRIAVTALCFVLVALLCSCGKYAPVKVNSQKIGKGIYNYFLDRARAQNPSADKKTQETAAKQMIIRYVAVNTEFGSRHLTLDAARKTALAKTVDSYWHVYSQYYEKIGVSRQDIYNIELSKAYKQELLADYYSDAVSDETLKEYFSGNYVALRTVMGFLTTVDENNNAVAMTDEQKKNITDEFSLMAEMVNSDGVELPDLAAEMQNITLTEDVFVISKENKYPDGFYEKVREIETGKAGSFVMGDYVFCVQRYDILSDELGLFEKYKLQCLEAIKGEEFEKIIDSWTGAYKTD